MFSFTLRLEGEPSNCKTDFQRLDYRRKHGLKDGTVVIARSYCGANDRTFQVDERFARTFFGGSFKARVVIHPDQLAPGELVDAYYYGSPNATDATVAIRPDLDLARAKELFLAGNKL